MCILGSLEVFEAHYVLDQASIRGGKLRTQSPSYLTNDTYQVSNIHKTTLDLGQL